MDKIIIEELEVFYRVGVPDQERATKQRLLISLELDLNFERAAATDDLTATIDYAAVCDRLLHFGEDREWKLIEKTAVDIADLILREFTPARIHVTIKKFIIPETKWVGVSIERVAR